MFEILLGFLREKREKERERVCVCVEGPYGRDVEYGGVGWW
jgi:hypothetical protein